MGNKKLQGADGMNFQLQLTIKGLESINLPEENLISTSGNDIMKIFCWGGKLSAYISLPNATRPNNIQPFQLSDCIKIELVRNQVIEHMRAYLQKHLKDKYSDEFLSMISVIKMECNLTIKCVGDCNSRDVIRLFEKSFAKITVYKETDPNGETHRKPEQGIATTKPHGWVLKVYNKTFQQRQACNLKVESNMIRVELVFLDRILDRMYSNEKSLEDILIRKAIKALIDQYQVTFDETCKENVIPMLSACVQDVFETLTQSDSGNEISDTLTKCEELIVDIKILRNTLKKWYEFREAPGNSKRMVPYYRNGGKFDIPSDVLKTLELMHNSPGQNRAKRSYNLLPCDPKLEKLQIS